MIYFKNGEKSFEHPSLRQKDGIVKFMKDPQEPPPPAPAAGKWSDEVTPHHVLVWSSCFLKHYKFLRNLQCLMFLNYSMQLVKVLFVL